MDMLGTGRQIGPFSARRALDLDGAYRVAAAVRQMREARGEKVVGRKIGFTNRTIWPQYGVYAPIWGYLYDTTVHDLADLRGAFSLAAFAEPLIEPEVVFGLAAAPDARMDEANCYPASAGWRTASRSCIRFFRAGSLRHLILRPLLACTVRF
jgi:2-oxo-3-hexenedioate decarboxylase